MGQPAVSALAPLPFELVLSDGDRLETEWHTFELPLLRDLILRAMVEQGRTDVYAGQDMFVYYSVPQARRVAEEEEHGLEKRAFRGPDVFWVEGVDPDRRREVWIAWEEDGRLPEVIFELLSRSTARKDLTEKKDLYAQVFGTAEYFLYDPRKGRFEGFRLVGRAYRPIRPDRSGRLWSEKLRVFVGTWHGPYEGRTRDWLRLFRPDGSLVPTHAEEAEAERQRAEAERQRAEIAEAELTRLRALLEERRQG